MIATAITNLIENKPIYKVVSDYLLLPVKTERQIEILKYGIRTKVLTVTQDATSAVTLTIEGFPHEINFRTSSSLEKMLVIKLPRNKDLPFEVVINRVFLENLGEYGRHYMTMIVDSFETLVKDYSSFYGLCVVDGYDWVKGSMELLHNTCSINANGAYLYTVWEPEIKELIKIVGEAKVKSELSFSANAISTGL